MGLAVEIRKRARQITLPVIGICVLGYFAYHFLHGERGLFAWVAISHEIEEAEALAAETTAQRLDLERRVSLLSPRSLDLDMLDERVRVMLNNGHPDDLVILNEGPTDPGIDPAN